MIERDTRKAIDWYAHNQMQKEKIQTISATVPITPFPEPVSIINKIPLKADSTNFIEDSNSPSFLMRFAGPTSGSDSNGIAEIS